MRLGCSGCLTAIVLVAIFVGTVGGAAWVVVRLLQEPDMAPVEATAAEGARAQQKLYELVRRGGGGAVTLTERELNGFLARHLEDATEVPLAGTRVHLLGSGGVEFAGRAPLRHLLRERHAAALVESLPASWRDRPVWLHLRARPGVEAGLAGGRRRYLRLEVDRLEIGRQPLPAVLLRLVLSPGALRVLQWPLPDHVEAVRVEAGRVVIQTGAPR